MGNYTTKNSDLTQILTIKAPHKRPSRKTHAFPEAKKNHKKSDFQQKVTRKEKKEAAYSQETKQRTKRDSAMMQTLKLYNKKSKVTMINMLKILLIKVDNMQDQMGNFSRIENFKKELSINAKNGKLFNRDEECLQRPYQHT